MVLVVGRVESDVLVSRVGVGGGAWELEEEAEAEEGGHCLLVWSGG